MLEIRQEAFSELTREHFYFRLRQFIIEQSPHPKMQTAIQSPQIWRSKWNEFWDGLKNKSEYHSAIRLTFILACECEDLDMYTILATNEQLSDEEFKMKQFLSDNDYIKFSAFDF